MRKLLIITIGLLITIPLLTMLLTDTFSGGRIHTSYIPLTVEQLANSSDVIVIGTVEGIDSSKQYTTSKTSYPITYFIVDIDSVIAGNYNADKIKVAVIGNEKYGSNEYDELLNESLSKNKVLLFLDYAAGSKDIYGDTYLYQGFQGKFSIDENSIAHNPEYEDIPLDRLIAIIKEARNR